MASDPHTTETKPAIRFSNFLRSRWLIALGASVTIGLGVFTLLGQVMQRQGMLVLLISEFKPILIRNEHQRNL